MIACDVSPVAMFTFLAQIFDPCNSNLCTIFPALSATAGSNAAGPDNETPAELQLPTTQHLQSLACSQPPNLSPHIDQQGGVHVKGVHTLSLALSGSAIFGVAVLVFLYCLISKRRCCASPSVESSVSLQLQPPAATSAQPQGQLMPTAPSAYMLQPADVENQLALLRAQQELQMAMLRHQQAKDQTADVTMPPGRMMAIDNNKFLVV